MGPFWDYDISFGNNNDSDCREPEGFYINTGRWFKRLFEDPVFKDSVAKRWKECSVSLEQSLLLLRSLAEQMEAACNLDDKIWQRFGYRQWPNAPGYKDRISYKDEVDYLLKWCEDRMKWLEKNFN